MLILYRLTTLLNGVISYLYLNSNKTEKCLGKSHLTTDSENVGWVSVKLCSLS